MLRSGQRLRTHPCSRSSPTALPSKSTLPHPPVPLPHPPNPVCSPASSCCATPSASAPTPQSSPPFTLHPELTLLSPPPLPPNPMRSRAFSCCATPNTSAPTSPSSSPFPLHLMLTLPPPPFPHPTHQTPYAVWLLPAALCPALPRPALQAHRPPRLGQAASLNRPQDVCRHRGSTRRRGLAVQRPLSGEGGGAAGKGRSPFCCCKAVEKKKRILTWALVKGRCSPQICEVPDVLTSCAAVDLCARWWCSWQRMHPLTLLRSYRRLC